MGAGAGNTPTEALAAVLAKMGVRTGVDVPAIAAAAEHAVRPVMDGDCTLDQMALTLGYAGVYSSFLKHAENAAAQHGVPGTEILLECGRRGLIGGQEDLIGEIAYELAASSPEARTREG
jgi:4-hydroxy 2-oxovalerate aldolase